MKWIDYRERLGIGFSDSGKAKMLSNMVSSFIEHGKLNENYTNEDHYRFCLMTGIGYAYSSFPAARVASLFIKNTFSVPKIISYYVAFVNTQIAVKEEHRRALFDILEDFLGEISVPVDIVWDEDGGFVFPKGVEELDRALVSAPLEWLSDYPQTHKEWINALKSYASLASENASDVADKFRKALERFFQEFFGKTQTLENMKSEYGRYMKEQGVPTEISNNLETLHQSYTNFMNNYAKHHDKTSKNVLEYIMYQTGNIIRLLITLKKEEQNA